MGLWKDYWDDYNACWNRDGGHKLASRAALLLCVTAACLNPVGVCDSRLAAWPPRQAAGAASVTPAHGIMGCLGCDLSKLAFERSHENSPALEKKGGFGFLRLCNSGSTVMFPTSRVFQRKFHCDYSFSLFADCTLPFLLHSSCWFSVFFFAAKLGDTSELQSFIDNLDKELAGKIRQICDDEGGIKKKNWWLDYLWLRKNSKFHLKKKKSAFVTKVCVNMQKWGTWWVKRLNAFKP